MELMLNYEPPKFTKQVSYHHKIVLSGSCFTEHIGNALAALKFRVLQNPNGILFDPISVAKSLQSYIQNKRYGEDEVFQLNDLWQSWQHHSRFSHIDRGEGLRLINDSQHEAHLFLKDADWLIITLGTAYSYRFSGEAATLHPAKIFGEEVANCHRAPSTWFNKYLLKTDEIITALDESALRLFAFNPNVHIIFTVSPVRHVRDGIVENSRSKARLIEAVQSLTASSDRMHYFPAYELVTDVLRDYRFYEADLVHPNSLATQFVFEKFTRAALDESSFHLMRDVKEIITARHHRSFQPTTEVHKHFLRSFLAKAQHIQKQFPFLDLSEELGYFSGNSDIL